MTLKVILSLFLFHFSDTYHRHIITPVIVSKLSSDRVTYISKTKQNSKKEMEI
jgi:hypothetical protein